MTCPLTLGKLTVNLKADVNDVVAMVPGLDEAVNLINDTVIANLQVRWRGVWWRSLITVVYVTHNDRSRDGCCSQVS